MISNLQVGQTVYVDHEACGDTRHRLGYTRIEDNKVVYRCFNCDYKGKMSFRQSKREVRGNLAMPKEASIPEDAEFNPAYWPKGAKDWVGDLIGEAMKHKFFYSDSQQRLSIPYFDADGLLWTNARYLGVDGAYPKYILRKTARMGQERPFYLNDWTPSQTVVLTEDCLSALHVSRLDGITGIACMGTTLSYDAIRKVQYLQPTKVYVFLDNDNKDVKRNQIKMKKQLDLHLTCEVEIVRADKDPKNLTTEKIYELLNSSVFIR